MKGVEKIMPTFKKVVVREKSHEIKNLDEEDQKNYNNKVLKLENACKEFEKKFKECLGTPKKWKIAFEYFFKEQMKKSRLTSRTSRVLHKMSKNLSQFDDFFDFNKLDEYIKAFHFENKKADNNNLIKRSAIDDKYMVDFFNKTIPDILKNKADEYKKLKVLPWVFNKEKGFFYVIKKEDMSKVKYYKENIKSFYIRNEEIKSIGKEMFANSQNLKSVSLGNVTTIGESAFYNCKMIEAIIMQKVKKIGDSAFALCESIQSVPTSSVESIGKHAFSGCKQLEDVDLSSLTAISNYTFSNCTNLSIVNFGESVTTIGTGAFSGCAAIRSINLKNVRVIKEKAFEGCENLQRIELPRVVTIGKGAFSGCKNISQVDLKNVREIGPKAFEGCENLRIINLSKSASVSKDSFAGCKNLKDIEKTK